MNSLSGILKKSGHDIFENIVEILGISLMASIPVLLCHALLQHFMH